MSTKMNLFLVKESMMAILFFVSVLCSCSGNDSTGKQPAENTTTAVEKTATNKMPVSACNLLTEEEAKAVLGGPVKSGMSTESMCQYVSASEELSKAGESVSVEVHAGAGSEFDAYVASIENDLKVKTKAVDGIGDKAVFAEGQLIVLKGQNFMTVIVGKRMNEEDQVAAEKAIAQKALDRLAAGG